MNPEEPGRRPPLGHRLAFRFALVLCLGVAVLFLLMAWWNVSMQRDHMLRLTERAAERCSRLIRSATRDGMLHNDLESVERVIRTIASSEGVRRVRILDRDGRVRRSSDPKVPGTPEETLPIEAFQCQLCHSLEPIPSDLTHQRRTRVIDIEGFGPHLNVVEPVPNEPVCSAACHDDHPNDRRVLGVIDIELSLGEMYRLLEESEKQLGAGLLVTLLALVLLSAFLTWRMVVDPVSRLARAADRVARGDFSARVPVTSGTEVGRMGTSWNAMVEELEKARDKLQEWSYMLEERVQQKTAEVEDAHGRMVVVEKMAALGNLAAVVAHEINNPLAGIATYARLLRKKCSEVEGCDVGPEASKALELMETEAVRCGSIVKNLLMFSRTPGARFAEEDLTPLLERCALLVHHKAELQDVELDYEVASNLPKIECDASQVQQVMLALLMNAIEAMPDGGTLMLKLTHDAPSDEVVLEVEDSGCGITSEALPKIYEPFFTTKDQGEGVGLGLSVVYGIVERHYGRIEVNSRPGRGTRFRVHLPCRQPPGTDEGAGT